MADVRLNSLTFPDLPDRYVIKDYDADIAQIFEDVYNLYPRKSLPSAPIHSFADGADNIPVKAMEVAVRAVQSGSGDPSPENVRPISGWSSARVFGMGKNMARRITETDPGTFTAVTDHDVVFTPVFNADGTLAYISATGTANGNAVYTVWENNRATVRSFMTKLMGQTVTVSGCPQGGSNSTYHIMAQGFVTAGVGVYDTGSGVSVTVANDTGTVQLIIRIMSGVHVSDLRFYPQVEIGNEKTAYEPYRGRFVTIDFNGTVYGGTLVYKGGKEWEFTAEYGIVKGTASNITRQSEKQWVINHAQIPLALIPTGNIGLMSDTFAPAPNNPETGKCLLNVYGAIRFTTESDYADASALVSAIGEPSFVYPLADPQTVTLTADAETVTEYGDNTLYSDCGDSSLTYRQDIGIILGE